MLELEIHRNEPQTQLKLEIGNQLQRALSLDVVNDAAFKACTAIYAKAKEWRKIIEQKRKEAVDPFRKQIAAINDKAKELSDPLEEIENVTKTKVDGYHRFLEEIKKKEEEKILELAKLLDEEQTPYITPMDSALRGDGAISYSKIEKRFQVTDISKVPAKYLMVNEAAIKNDIKLGIQEIPGVRIYEEKTTQLRRR